MQVHYICRSSTFMEVIDVLRYDLRASPALHSSHSQMAGVGLRLNYQATSPLIPGPDSFTVAGPGLRRCQFSRIEGAP